MTEQATKVNKILINDLRTYGKLQNSLKVLKNLQSQHL